MISRSNFVLIVVSVALAVALAISIRSCRNNKQSVNDLQTYQQSLADTLQHLKNNVVEKPAVFANSAAFDQIVSENASLKKELALIKVKPKQVQNITTVVNTISIPDTIVMRDTIAGVVVKRDSVVFKTESDSENIVTAHKSFMFKKSQYDLYIHHSNPHVNTTGMQSITIRDNKKWYQTGAVKTIAAFVAGIYISQKLLK